MAPLEKHLEDDVVSWAESLGGEALKLKIDGRRGFPDRTILLPGGLVLFPEVKRSKSAHHRYQQIWWIDRLKDLGFTADFVSSFDQVEAMYESIRRR